MSRKLRWSLIVFLLLTGLILTVVIFFKDKQKKILDNDVDVLQQYLWFYPYKTEWKVFSELMDKGDPMRLTTYVFRDFYQRKNVSDTTRMVDAIIEKWDLNTTYRLDYKFPHNKIPAGWWSGMDNLLFPLLLIALDQENQDTTHRRLAKGMLEQATKTPIKGGVLWDQGAKGCWLSEYAWAGMKERDEYYVLNGHLFALQALKMAADALNEDSYQKAYQCALKGTKERMSEFAGPHSPWPSTC